MRILEIISQVHGRPAFALLRRNGTCVGSARASDHLGFPLASYCDGRTFAHMSGNAEGWLCWIGSCVDWLRIGRADFKEMYNEWRGMLNAFLVEWLSIEDTVFAEDNIFQSSLKRLFFSSGLFVSSRRLFFSSGSSRIAPRRLHTAVLNTESCSCWMNAKYSRCIPAAARRSNTHLVLVSSGRDLEITVSFHRQVPFECLLECIRCWLKGLRCGPSLDTESCRCNAESTVWLPLAVMSVGC